MILALHSVLRFLATLLVKITSRPLPSGVVPYFSISLSAWIQSLRGPKTLSPPATTYRLHWRWPLVTAYWHFITITLFFLESTFTIHPRLRSILVRQLILTLLDRCSSEKSCRRVDVHFFDPIISSRTLQWDTPRPACLLCLVLCSIRDILHFPKVTNPFQHNSRDISRKLSYCRSQFQIMRSSLLHEWSTMVSFQLIAVQLLECQLVGSDHVSNCRNCTFGKSSIIWRSFTALTCPITSHKPHSSATTLFFKSRIDDS